MQVGSGVVDRAVAVIVIADGTVEIVILQDTVECLSLGGVGACALGKQLHVSPHCRAAGARELSIDLDHAAIASLNRPKLRVIANLRKTARGE